MLSHESRREEELRLILGPTVCFELALFINQGRPVSALCSGTRLETSFQSDHGTKCDFSFEQTVPTILGWAAAFSQSFVAVTTEFISSM